jgi:beta-xylosidase
VQNRPEAIAKNMRQIDPFIFIDSDEKAYLYHVRFDRGNHIYVAELESDLTTIKSNTLTHVISALPKTWEKTNTLPRANVVEGPTVIKQKGLYYLLYSANHFKSQDYAVGFATATSPLGPWVRGDDSPILHYKATALKGSGHGDAFVDANGDWQYVFHAHSSDQSVHPRKTYIVPFKFIPKPDAPDTITMEIDKLRPLYVNRTANQQSGVNSK